MRRVPKCCACFCVIFFLCTCSSSEQSQNSDDRLRSFFVVVPSATGIKQSVFQGKDQIIYHVHAEYPADDVINAIKVRVRQLGWEPLKEDWLNPGLPTSQVRGWTYFEDWTTRPRTSVQSWNGEWQNQSGDILQYMLTYTCPDNRCSSTFNLQDMTDLKVIAIRVPADLAKRIKASVAPDKAGK